MIQGQPLVRGQAQGVALVSDEPISFWGGYDHHTGEITDRRHPLSGSISTGRILAVPFTRGSSTTTAVLLEAARAGTAPVAIITTGLDAFFALASIVATEMYGVTIPVVAVSPQHFDGLRTGDSIQITADGQIHVHRS
ncbi:aconitase X swivel domain-containing protein [Chloroflexota bacterium]